MQLNKQTKLAGFSELEWKTHKSSRNSAGRYRMIPSPAPISRAIRAKLSVTADTNLRSPIKYRRQKTYERTSAIQRANRIPKSKLTRVVSEKYS